MPIPDRPNQIHRYRILAEIGRGSMGRVFLAEDPNIDRRLAIKLLSPRHAVDPKRLEELQERFLVEAKAAGRLQHPGIVAVYDAGTDPESGAPYLAMEWVDGRSLFEVLQDGAVDVPRAVDWVAQVARALDFAHRQGVIHRDIKPANLLVTEGTEGREVVKVVDFGIAKLASGQLTQTGYVVGTPNYMAPEQVRGRPLDGRADLFALGAVLYECLTGKSAFGADDLANVQYKILSVDPRPPEMYNPAVTPTLRRVVDQALAKKPDHRFASGAELARALEQALAQDPQGAPPETGVDPALLTMPLPVPTKTQAPSDRSSGLPVADRTSLRDPGLPAAASGKGWYALAAFAFVLLALLALFFVASPFEPPTPPPPEPTLEVVFAERYRARAQTEGELQWPSRAPEPPAELAATSLLETLPLPLEEAVLSPLPLPRSMEPASPKEFADTEDTPAPPAPLTSPPVIQVPLDITFRSRLKLAYVSLWIDGERYLTQRLEVEFPRRLFAGRNFDHHIEVPAGRRTLEVHLSGLKPRLELRHQVRRTFVAGEPQALRVRLVNDELQLSFEEATP